MPLWFDPSKDIATIAFWSIFFGFGRRKFAENLIVFIRAPSTLLSKVSELGIGSDGMGDTGLGEILSRRPVRWLQPSPD
jgi:hypothetical protein